MRVIIDKITYHVEFYHENEISIRVCCKITAEGMLFMRLGCVKANSKINFNMKKGRKLALSKTLKECKFKKEDRTIFCNEYRKWEKVRF